MREMLSYLPHGTLSPQQVTATARLSLRGSTGAAVPQVQEVVIRLSALLPGEEG